MNKILLSTVALASGFCAFLPATGLALDVTVLGRVGYNSLTVKKKSDDTYTPKPITGYDLGVLGQISFVDLTVASLYGGAGLSYASQSSKIKYSEIADTEIEIKQSGIILPVEVGVSFKAIPLLTLQGALGYDLGLTGSGESKINGGTAAKFDITSYGAMVVNLRAMMSVLPFVMGGLEFQYAPMGNSETKDKDSGVKTKSDFTGWAARLVVGVGI